MAIKMKEMKCLINIISEQNMPNFIPVLALKPNLVINITTNRNSAIKAKYLEKAIGELDNNIEVRECTASENNECPGRREMENIVSEEIEKHMGYQCYINISGGTKTMAIGAYSAATRLSAGKNVWVIYTNRNNIEYIYSPTNDSICKTNEELGKTYESCKNLLDLIVLTNNGETIERKLDFKRYAKLAELLYAFFLKTPNIDIKKACEDTSPQALSKLVKSLDANIINEAINVDLLGKNGNEYYSSSKVFGNNNDFMQFFSGAWWEVYIANILNRTGIFKDIRWSATVNNMEEDIIALPHNSATPFIFSMKRSFEGNRLLPHLFEFAGRANSIGSTYAKKFICIFKYNTRDENKEYFEKNAKLHHIEIVLPHDIKTKLSLEKILPII